MLGCFTSWVILSARCERAYGLRKHKPVRPLSFPDSCILQLGLTTTHKWEALKSRESLRLCTSTGMCCFLLVSTFISNGMRYDAHVTVPCRNWRLFHHILCPLLLNICTFLISLPVVGRPGNEAILGCIYWTETLLKYYSPIDSLFKLYLELVNEDWDCFAFS